MSWRSYILLVLSVLNLVYQNGWLGGVVVTPAPIDVPGLHVLLIEETEDRNAIGQGQLAVLQSTLVKQDVAAANGQFRQYDDDHAPDAEPWKTAMARPRQSTPWLIVSNPGKGGFEGPLPDSVDATLKIIGGLK